jgi:hypothetical protein
MSGITNEECEDSPLIERAKGPKKITSEEVGAALLLAKARSECQGITDKSDPVLLSKILAELE